MHPERAPIPEDFFSDSTERTDSANDTSQERKRSPEFKIDENREGETREEAPEEGSSPVEKEPTFEELALGIAMEKHGGRADEWKPNNDFPEWNKNYIREDGEIVDHRGIPVMESAMKDPKGTESVEFKRFVEVQEYLKNEANIGVPIYSGDYIRVENGKEIYQVTSAVRRENGEIEYMPLEYVKELAEENDENNVLYENTEDERTSEEEVDVPFVMIEDDGSMSIDLTAAFAAELEEVFEEYEVAEVTTTESAAVPAKFFAVEQKVFTEEIAPQVRAFKALESELPAQEVFFPETIEQTPEIASQEVMPDLLPEALAEIKENNEPPPTLQKESIPTDDSSRVLEKENILLEASTIVKSELARQEEIISVVLVEEVMGKEVMNVTEVKSIPAVSDEIKKERAEEKSEVILVATQDVLEKNVLVTEATNAQVEELMKESVLEKVIPESFAVSIISMETIQSIQSETRQNIKAEENSIELKEIIPVQDAVIKIFEETKREKAEAVMAGNEEVKIISESRTEQVIEFMPGVSADEPNSHAKESPFFVYENELQLRETTEQRVGQQESEQSFAGIPDGSMSPANAAVAANDNTEETRVAAPTASEGVTQNGITLNLRDAA